MFKGRRIIAVIPARKGSKRLPNKNIRKLCGRPLVAHTIVQAKKSRYVDEVVVSTDDKDIIRIADRCGALAPFIRPARLASDSAKTIDVLLHAISWLEREGQIYDIVVLLQPTSPLRSVADIDTAIKLLFKKQASAIVSVCRDEHHPFWANTLPRSGSMKKFMRKELRNKRSQDLPVFYRLNGAVYVIYSEALKREKDFYGDRTFAYIMPGKRSVDIDNELDFGFAEYLVKKR